MEGAEIVKAREELGKRWNLRRGVVKAAELGRLLRLTGRDPGFTVRRWETGVMPVPGPVSVAIDMWLSGALPPDFEAEFSRRKVLNDG